MMGQLRKQRDSLCKDRNRMEKLQEKGVKETAKYKKRKSENEDPKGR